jgi:hypothetical protein
MLIFIHFSILSLSHQSLGRQPTRAAAIYWTLLQAAGSG